MNIIDIEKLFECHYMELKKDWAGMRQLALTSLEDSASGENALKQALSIYISALHGLFDDENTIMYDKGVTDTLDALLRQDLTTNQETAMLGLIYGSLRNANLFLKREDIGKRLREIKRYVFENLILGGMLVSDAQKSELKFDTLLACVPFGLFEPEDLVLVEAVKALSMRALSEEDAVTDTETLLLAWYFIEQGSYDRARTLCFKVDSTSVLKELVQMKLKLKGQLENRFILHRPYGNGNRYEPCMEERFPKVPQMGEPVIIQAVAVPFDAECPVALLMNGTVYSGNMTDGVWRFEVPLDACTDQYDYELYFVQTPSVRTERFTFKAGKQVTLSTIEAIEKNDNSLELMGNGLSLSFELDGETLKTQISKNTVLEDHYNEVKEAVKNTELYEKNTCHYGLGDFTIRIVLSPFSFVIEKDKTFVIRSVREDAVCCIESDQKIVESQLHLQLGQEKIYGLGERYNALNQNGNYVDQFVYNQYKDQGLRTYMPMPIAYTTGGYGLYLETHAYSYFDFGSKQTHVLTLGTESERFEAHIVTGAVKEQVCQINQMTGPAEMVPAWALGPWMSSNNWDSDKEVRKQVELTKHHNIPATVLVIEAWSDEATFYIFNDAVYEEKTEGSAHKYEDFEFPEWGRWPDPKDLVKYLHANDLKCILWQIPIIKQITSLHHRQKNLDEKHFIENGYGVVHEDGTPYRLPEGWFKDSLLMDFSSEAARTWWFDKRQYLLDAVHVDGFKTDGGEFVFGNTLKFSDGRTGFEMRNAYPNDYIEAYYDFAQQNGGITFSRAGYTGAQKFPAHWAGDERSTFDAFKRSILAGLSAGLSGVIFWGWDLAGFSGDVPSAELFIRSAEMAAFCPIMQYHAESKAELNQDRTPWNIAKRSGDERAISVYRYYANVRMSLLPYMVQESKASVASGLPLMRPLVLEYEQDEMTHEIWDTYMFGSKLLIAPVIEAGQEERTLYLPQGRWWHLFDEYWMDGMQSVTVEAPLEKIPVFVKEGTVVPINLKYSGKLGDAMSSKVDHYSDLSFLIAGQVEGTYAFEDTEDHVIQFEFEKNSHGVLCISIGGHIRNIGLRFTEYMEQVQVNGTEYKCVKEIAVKPESIL